MSPKTAPKPRHTARDSGQRFRKTPPCDACNKPVGTDYMSDPAVCGGGDGPGFYLCDRVRCCAKRDVMDVDARRALYAAAVAAR